jgi:hypothetical protein
MEGMERGDLDQPAEALKRGATQLTPRIGGQLFATI